MNKTFLLTHIRSTKRFEVYATTHPASYELTIVNVHIPVIEFEGEKPPKYIQFSLEKAKVTGG